MTYDVCVISLCELTKREKWIYSDTHRITLHKWGEPTRWHPTLNIEYIHFSGFFGWFWLFWFIQLNCQCVFITSTPIATQFKGETHLDLLHRDLDDVVIYPGEAHLDLLLEVGPPRPVGQRSVQQRLDPGEAVAEDRVQGHAHPVDKLNLPQIFLSEPSSGHENSTKYLKWIQIYLFEVAGQQYAVVASAV